MRVETRLYINTDRANVQIAFEIPESEWRAISQTKQCINAWALTLIKFQRNTVRSSLKK